MKQKLGPRAKQVQAFGKKYLDTVRVIKRKAALELYKNVMITTPIDQGFLANNWFFSEGMPDTDRTVNRRTDASRQSAIDRTQREMKRSTVDQTFYFTNNLPYAYRIEYEGHSTFKAPDGMVRVNAVNWDQMVSNWAKYIASGGSID